MSEQAGPLKIDIHSDKLDVRLELRNVGELAKSWGPTIAKIAEYVQGIAVAHGFPMPATPPEYAADPNVPPIGGYPDHHHAPSNMIREMLTRQCNNCLDDIAKAVQEEQERRAADMS